jgi:hypothetical protein
MQLNSGRGGSCLCPEITPNQVALLPHVLGSNPSSVGVWGECKDVTPEGADFVADVSSTAMWLRGSLAWPLLVCRTESLAAVVCSTESLTLVACRTKSLVAVVCRTESLAAIVCRTKSFTALVCRTKSVTAVVYTTESLRGIDQYRTKDSLSLTVRRRILRGLPLDLPPDSIPTSRSVIMRDSRSSSRIGAQRLGLRVMQGGMVRAHVSISLLTPCRRLSEIGC